MVDASPETNALGSRVTKVLQRSWKWLLAIVGVPTFADVVKEYVRSKTLDYVASKFGRFGDFALADPVALTSIGVVTALVVLMVMVLSESIKETPSIIYEHRDKPFTKPRPPTRFIIGFSVVMVFIIFGVGFGSYTYWLHTLNRPTNGAFNTNPKTTNQPLLTNKTPIGIESEGPKIEHAELENGSLKKKQQQSPIPPENRIVPKPTESSPSLQESQVADAPPSIIPQDPVRAVEEVNRMRNSVSDVLGKKDTVTFLMSWSNDDSKYLAFISNVLSTGCRVQPRQCWFTQPANEGDLDRPPVKGEGKRGITVHGPDAEGLARALRIWFTVYSTSNVPHEYGGYNQDKTKELMWIEIGPGSPWKVINTNNSPH
jgi:hypothetical protein